MFVALDPEGNRIHASDAEKGHPYYCQECGGELHLRGGQRRRLHFAHLKENKEFEHNSDYNHEWHIRMQDYFPKETREVRFVDQETGEIHIADIFLPDSNTVFEFQHSKITQEEYVSRTLFHLKNKRRIVWVFDESSTANKYGMGRFKPDKERHNNGLLFYKWLGQPRSFLNIGPDLRKFASRYSLCVYTGTEGDVLRRIIKSDWDYEYVGFSSVVIPMSSDLEPDLFFLYDEHWQAEDIARQQREEMQIQLMQHLQQGGTVNSFIQRTGWTRRHRRF